MGRIVNLAVYIWRLIMIKYGRFTGSVCGWRVYVVRWSPCTKCSTANLSLEHATRILHKIKSRSTASARLENFHPVLTSSLRKAALTFYETTVYGTNMSTRQKWYPEQLLKGKGDGLDSLFSGIVLLVDETGGHSYFQRGCHEHLYKHFIYHWVIEDNECFELSPPLSFHSERKTALTQCREYGASDRDFLSQRKSYDNCTHWLKIKGRA